MSTVGLYVSSISNSAYLSLNTHFKPRGSNSILSLNRPILKRLAFDNCSGGRLLHVSEVKLMQFLNLAARGPANKNKQGKC